ncbi:MAG: acyltransferase [Fibrobacterales bacterium]
MGISILLVCLYHAHIYFNEHLFLYPFRLIKNFGYIGVDIFFVLSGLGLVYSRNKNKEPLSRFFAKRFVRILPAYWIIITLSLITLQFYTGIMTPLWLLLRYSTLGFWLNINSYGWYIPTAFMFYLLFPSLNSLYQKHCFRSTIILSLISILMGIISYFIELNHLIIVFSRLPAFLIGIHVGHTLLHKSETQYNRVIMYTLSSSALASVVVLLQLFNYDDTYKAGLLWYPIAIMALPITLCLADTIRWITTIKKIPRFLLTFLSFCGTYSLEIFLVHGWIYGLGSHTKYFKTIPFLESINSIRLLEYGTYFLITLLLSWVLAQICAPIQKVVLRK